MVVALVGTILKAAREDNTPDLCIIQQQHKRSMVQFLNPGDDVGFPLHPVLYIPHVWLVA